VPIVCRMQVERFTFTGCSAGQAPWGVIGSLFRPHLSAAGIGGAIEGGGLASPHNSQSTVSLKLTCGSSRTSDKGIRNLSIGRHRGQGAISITLGRHSFHFRSPYRANHARHRRRFRNVIRTIFAWPITIRALKRMCTMPVRFLIVYRYSRFPASLTGVIRMFLVCGANGAGDPLNAGEYTDRPHSAPDGPSFLLFRIAAYGLVAMSVSLYPSPSAGIIVSARSFVQRLQHSARQRMQVRPTTFDCT